ncbi:uncharacterized protein LOC128392624 [Panonychus citri]|uniref:uncharacterized protein LOC128392624 n=1 Tax=Panonychus citri TaxID=50023 RepID=UPI002307703D|nr:uncharacterized protein LOC128392624 [Panonychus citri]
MNNFPNQGFSNQSGSQFGAVVAKVYSNYGDNGDSGESLTHFNHLASSIREEGVASYHQLDNSNTSNHLCDNCAVYSEQIECLCQENELLHQLVDNLRKRAKDSQAHSSLQMVRKYESSKESNHLFVNNEIAVKSSVVQTFKPFGAVKDEDKVTINRLKAEMDFYKALNTNTDSCWRKKLDDLQSEKDSVIKELQKFIADNSENINRLTKELETVKHSKQESINQLTSKVFSVQSANQKTIASLTTELEKTKAEKAEAKERIFKMVHELATSETKAQEALARVRELTKILKENQETINELNHKLDNLAGKESQNDLDKLTKDLAETKEQYHLQMNKLSRDIEAIQFSKRESQNRNWRK